MARSLTEPFSALWAAASPSTSVPSFWAEPEKTDVLAAGWYGCVAAGGVRQRNLRPAGRAVVILTQSGGERTMREYITAAGIALGLLAVWAALVPLVA
jgi:hypothetical protein